MQYNQKDLPPGVKLEYTSFGRNLNQNQGYQGPGFSNQQQPNQIQQNSVEETIKAPAKKIWGPNMGNGSTENISNNNIQQQQQTIKNPNSIQKKPLGGWADDDDQNVNQQINNNDKKPKFLNKFKKNNDQQQQQQVSNDTNNIDIQQEQLQDETDFCLLLPEELEKYQLEQSKVNNIVKDGGLRLKQKHEDMENFIEGTKNVNIQILGSMLIYKLLENTSVKTKARTIFAIQELCLKNDLNFQFFKFHQNHIRNSVPIDDFNQQVEIAIEELLLLFKNKESFEINLSRKREMSQTFDVNFQVEDDILGIENKKNGQSQEIIALSDSQNITKFKKENEPKFPFLKKKMQKTNSSLGNSQVQQFNSNSSGQNFENKKQFGSSSQNLNQSQQGNNSTTYQSQCEENLLDADPLVDQVQQINLNQKQPLNQSTGIEAIQSINFNNSNNNFNNQQQQQQQMNINQQHQNQQQYQQQQQQFLPQGYQQPIQKPQPQYMPAQINYNQLQNNIVAVNNNNINNSNNVQTKNQGKITNPDIFDQNQNFQLEQIPKISEKKKEQCEKAFDFIKF